MDTQRHHPHHSAYLVRHWSDRVNMSVCMCVRVCRSKIAASLSSVDIATRRTVVAMAMHLVTLLDSIVTSVYRYIDYPYM